jgi:hypothetical protein
MAKKTTGKTTSKKAVKPSKSKEKTTTNQSKKATPVETKKNTKQQETKLEQIQKNPFKAYFANILPNREQNLYILVYLLSIVVLLVSGVLFYTSQLLVVTSQENELLQQNLESVLNHEEFSVYRYTFDEFSRATKRDMVSIMDVLEYLNEKEFSEISSTGFTITGIKKDFLCQNSKIREKEVCRTVIISVDLEQEKPITVRVENNPLDS